MNVEDENNNSNKTLKKRKCQIQKPTQIEMSPNSGKENSDNEYGFFGRIEEANRIHWKHIEFPDLFFVWFGLPPISLSINCKVVTVV